MEWDVVVIGAGPAGSMAAQHIARAGFAVLLVEKDMYAGYSNSCAGGMAFVLANRLKIPSHVVEKEIYGYTLHFNSEVTNRWSTNRPIFITVYRRVFDRFLAQQAVNYGATLLTYTRVVEVNRINNRMLVSMKNLRDGKRKEVVSKLVVFADGVNTLARKIFNIGFAPCPDNTFLALAYELEAPANSINKFEFYFAPQSVPWGCYWVFPKKERLNVGVACLRSKIKRNLRRSLDHFIEDAPLLNNKRKLRFTAGLIPLDMAKNIIDDNCLVVGDAAGMVNPLTGGGLVFAVKSGELAARTCILALEKKEYTLAALSNYPKNLWLTRHFWWLKVLGITNKIFFRLSHLSGRSFYPGLLKGYAFFFRSLPLRWIRNI